jgi:hypothetical protein
MSTTAFTIVDYSISRDVIASIHKVGCKDIAKDAARHGGVCYEEVGPTLQDALDSFLDAEMREVGWSEDHVKILPCAKGAEAGRANRELNVSDPSGTDHHSTGSGCTDERDHQAADR